jgi:hypothetical protein
MDELGSSPRGPCVDGRLLHAICRRSGETVPTESRMRQTFRARYIARRPLLWLASERIHAVKVILRASPPSKSGFLHAGAFLTSTSAD